jgi:glycosyltransferase involved in cell wall biosynthesis
MPLSSRTDMSAISVAMPVFNGAVYLPAQLESIARQTLLPAELVVCDNVSTDDSLAVLEDFARRAPFPVHIHPNTTHIGADNNFHRAFSLCSNPIIAYCDADDVWVPEKLAKCLAVVSQPGVVLVSHRSRLTDSELRPLGVVLPDGLEPGKYAFPHFPLRYWGFGHQMVFSRELVPIMNWLRATVPVGSVPTTNLDELIPIAAGMLGDTIYLPEPLMDFRRHNRAVTFVHTMPFYDQSSKPSVDARLVRKRFVLARKRKIILELRDWLGSQSAEISSDGERWARYAAHLDETLRAVEVRLAMHQGANLLGRARAFVSALGACAYRDPRKGGSGRHQVMIDLLAVLKPAREPEQYPKTKATRTVA